MVSFVFLLRFKLNVYTRALFQSPLSFKRILYKLRFASKEIRREVNAEKTKCTAMSWDQKAGQNNNSKSVNEPFESVVQLQNWGTNLTDQTSIQEEVKSRLK